MPGGDTAQAITGRHAGYVMTVKATCPTLYKQLKKLPWTAIPATSAVRERALCDGLAAQLGHQPALGRPRQHYRR
jgi:hypothetical protein